MVVPSLSARNPPAPRIFGKYAQATASPWDIAVADRHIQLAFEGRARGLAIMTEHIERARALHRAGRRRARDSKIRRDGGLKAN